MRRERQGSSTQCGGDVVEILYISLVTNQRIDIFIFLSATFIIVKGVVQLNQSPFYRPSYIPPITFTYYAGMQTIGRKTIGRMTTRRMTICRKDNLSKRQFVEMTIRRNLNSLIVFGLEFWYSMFPFSQNRFSFVF